MQPLNYFTIINTYIPQGSQIYRMHLVHATLVTAKALSIARRLGLSAEQQRFIEEAAMLHDIGIVKVNGFGGSVYEHVPYICHAPIGREILENEGLARHALVAERHVGVGLSKEDILDQNLPLPARDMVPETIEEEIICWADLFYGKHPERLWEEHALEHITHKVKAYGPRQEQVFQNWLARFGS